MKNLGFGAQSIISWAVKSLVYVESSTVNSKDHLLILVLLFLVLVVMLFIVQGVAFITLCERHLLGGSHQRIGPNKVSLSGLLQAVFDGVKLMKKEQLATANSSHSLFLVLPGLTFLVMYTSWFVLPFFFEYFTFEHSLMFFLVLVGFSVYSFLLCGVFSKSKYSMVGAVRAASQSVSYEITFSLYILCIMIHYHLFSLCRGFNLSLMLIFLPLGMMVLAELNRAPFDFSEGESELVSGYNVEFGSVTFALLFIGEYGSLLFFSTLVSALYFNFSLLVIYLLFCTIVFIRSTFPRYRYDMMMGLFWFKMLPVALLFLFFFVAVYY